MSPVLRAVRVAVALCGGNPFRAVRTYRAWCVGDVILIDPQGWIPCPADDRE